MPQTGLRRTTYLMIAQALNFVIMSCREHALFVLLIFFMKKKIISFVVIIINNNFVKHVISRVIMDCLSELS